MLNIRISAISRFIKYFTTWQIKEAARDTGYTKRRDGKLLPSTFIQAFTVGLWSLQNKSLEHICGVCEKIQPGLSITKSALFQRLETGAELLKEMLKLAFEHCVNTATTAYPAEVIKQFKNIYLIDATSIILPKKLSEIFRSSGGTNKNAQLKIQTMFNLVTRTFQGIKVTKSTENDRVYLRSVFDQFKERDLVLFDLGYFATEIFFEITQRGCAYVSRIQSKTVFFADADVSDEKTMDIKSILKKSNGALDINVYIGHKCRKRIPVRLIAEKLPEKVASERIRKANKRTSKHKKDLTDYQRLLLSWNIVITNIPRKDLTPQSVMALYRVRWQIEILFKACKSHLKLKDIGEGGKAQQECILYGRLILAVMMTSIYSVYFCAVLKEKNRMLSILKFISHLQDRATGILNHLICNIKNIQQLYEIFGKAAQRSLYEKRTRLNTMELLSMQHMSTDLLKSG